MKNSLLKQSITIRYPGPRTSANVLATLQEPKKFESLELLEIEECMRMTSRSSKSAQNRLYIYIFVHIYVYTLHTRYFAYLLVGAKTESHFNTWSPKARSP